jgi:hypothetical protein
LHHWRGWSCFRPGGCMSSLLLTVMRAQRAFSIRRKGAFGVSI